MTRAACSVCGVPISEHPDTDACAIRDESALWFRLSQGDRNDLSGLASQYPAVYNACRLLRAEPVVTSVYRRPGWWHPQGCIDRHDDDHNCLDEQGSIIGWREPLAADR